MKSILLTSIAVATGLLASSALADDLSVFRVCQDQRVLHTSDGADAGHIEYIVMDPGSDRIVSAVVTGGVGAERHVAIPIEAMRFGADREITFTNITRETIVSAPVIEVSTFSTSAVIHPEVIERTYTHFGFNPSSIRVSGGAAFENRNEVRGQNDPNRANAALDQNANRDGAQRETAARDQNAPQNREATASADREAASRERNATQNRNGANAPLDREAAPRGTTERAATKSETNHENAAFGGTSGKEDSQRKVGADSSATKEGEAPHRSSTESGAAPGTPSKYKSAVSEGQSHEQAARPEAASGSSALRGKSAGEEKSATSATKSTKPAGAEAEHRGGKEAGRGEHEAQ